MTEPIYHATLRALAGRYAREAVRAGLAWADNPLASGRFCDRCGTRLDKADRPCPVCPTPRLAILNGSALIWAVAANA